MTPEEASERARHIALSVVENNDIALLSTADTEGRAHATWMATIAVTDERQIITLTSPDSRKAANIESNPNVEWQFFDEDKSNLVYLTGTAEIVFAPDEIRKYWNLMKHKEQAFFLDHFNSGMGFAIVRTEVVSVQYVQPRENESCEIDIDLFWKRNALAGQ